jgi:hypothetical protein
MGLIGRRSEAPLSVGFVVQIVSLEPDHFAITFEGQDVSCNTV